jgi:glycolate oxidase iron-sulfur subunit
LLPESLRAGLDLLPPKLEPAFALPARTAAKGPRRARVALLSGCAQQVLAPDIHCATLEVLSRNGVEVIVPAGQGCCGALALHAGDEKRARRLARHNLGAFALDPSNDPANDYDAIVTNAAGCGSGLRETARLFLGTPEEERAAWIAAKVRDVAEFLDDLGLVETAPRIERRSGALRIAYQDACHLGHAQRVRDQPRRLLRSLEGAMVLTPVEPEVCCGSAGTYNLEQPVIAAQLGERKARHLIETGADLIVSGNIGCITQIQHHLELRGDVTPVRHTMQVLRDAYHGRLSHLGSDRVDRVADSVSPVASAM